MTLRKTKKSQAAMEFLMTYGWAILAAVIAIGVLAYFGVFTPGKYTAGTAIVTAPWYVNAWNVKAADTVTLELKNNGGENYDLLEVSLDDDDDLCDDSESNSGSGWTVEAGDSQAVTISCTGDLTEGNNFKGDITIVYQKSGSDVNLTSTGTLAEKVTA